MQLEQAFLGQHFLTSLTISKHQQRILLKVYSVHVSSIFRAEGEAPSVGVSKQEPKADILPSSAQDSTEMLIHGA